MAQSTDPMSISPDGQGHVSMFGKAKNKAKQLRDRVKENYKGYGGDDKEEEEEKSVEDQGHEKPDENVEDVTKGMAGLSGLGTANKDDRANQESGKVNKSRLGDILGKNDDGNDELRHKDSILTDEKENPKEVLSSFEESGQGRGNNGDVFLTTEKEEIGTDDGTPSIPERMSGAIGGIIGLGKGNKQEEEGGEETNSSKFDQPTLGLKEVPKALEEEFQSLLEKSKDTQSDDVGEGNELSCNEKPIEEMKSGTPVVTKKASGLMQGIRDSLTSGQGKKDDIVEEEQSGENQDNRMQSQGEKKEGQSYAEKLFAAKSVISSKLGYGGLPSEEKGSVEESKGEDELQGPETEEVESGASVVTKKDSGLIQGLTNYLKSDQGNKDDIVMQEKQSRENQDMEIEEEEEKGGQKSGIASKLGFGNLPSEEKADFEEPKREEKADFEKSEEDKLPGPKAEEGTENKEKSEEDKLPGPKAEEGTENKEKTFKSILVSKLSPGEDDKALSEKITEAFNNSAKSILGGFYGGSPKVEATPSPSSENGATAELPQNNNPQNASSPKGIMGRVTGVMSSFIGKKPKEDSADNSPRTQVSSAEPIFGKHKEDPIGSSETQTRNQIEGGTK